MTDIDGAEPGEVELELNGSELRALRGGAYVVQSSVEGEWLATHSLGIRLEPAFSHSVETGGAQGSTTIGGDVAASWKLLQDVRRDIYAQAEIAARLPWTAEAIVDPGASALPFVFDLRSAVRRGRWTLRSSIGVGAGETSPHVPLRGSVAVLTGFASSERYGFWGIEADVDGTRKTPAVLALNLVPHLGSIGLPFRLALAIPWVVGSGQERPSTGIFLRLLFESAREYEYGKTGE